MSDHIVTSYDEDLKELASKISEMGGRAERLVEDSIKALVLMDMAGAAEAVEKDVIINSMDQEIEEKAVLTIARRQPMAQDLREIVSALRISVDLERIADLGKNIARRTLALEGKNQPKQLVHGIEHMAELTLAQLRTILDAYTARDDMSAIAVWHKDREVDALYNSLFREFLTYMMEDPRNISFCTHLLFCAKNLERIGDHVTNIAETIYYLNTGLPLEDRQFKEDEHLDLD
ncbi:phosphate signaling complex protein PhoU [Cohaesibacter gelatinilyticus]|mgnify:CR=1 FL=1|uniref:Phosphate-specific transport system accessory protein PhoU n=1 Tax=Cohaesibacter gelatinilyticus TaxID=372072 RepID=A0A285PNW6_9HYPH|nr:phosphate signaling complex protein PhoU [Cohaesibacter gelatinilyticus]SNZ21611.1 phosphate uptake regulator, PhoU [Cohaesibacter gelatinilyticus]